VDIDATKFVTIVAMMLLVALLLRRRRLGGCHDLVDRLQQWKANAMQQQQRVHRWLSIPFEIVSLSVSVIYPCVPIITIPFVDSHVTPTIDNDNDFGCSWYWYFLRYHSAEEQLYHPFVSIA
jgi:hypothetical protein